MQYTKGFTGGWAKFGKDRGVKYKRVIGPLCPLYMHVELNKFTLSFWSSTTYLEIVFTYSTFYLKINVVLGNVDKINQTSIYTKSILVSQTRLKTIFLQPPCKKSQPFQNFKKLSFLPTFLENCSVQHTEFYVLQKK